jgi:septal ring factor EnvC (AmiA/AmiB activator)
MTHFHLPGIKYTNQVTTTQLDKITIILHSIQKDMKSTKGQSKLIKQLQSQIKQLRTQMSQIQKNIAKRNFTAATISSRKKIVGLEMLEM